MKYQYDVAILGGGSGGLVAASSMSQLGLRVLLVEKERLGGDCLWYGCVPSKALIASASRSARLRSADAMGVRVRDVQPDFARIMERMREVQHAIEPHDSPERFRSLGAHVEFGEPHFVSNHEILLGKKRRTFKYAIIATGSSPSVPDISGIEDVPYLTNLDLFSLNTLPSHLLVVGGGPIGAELAQAFGRFGSEVTVFARSGLLPREDEELVNVLEERFRSEGITVVHSTVTGVQRGVSVLTEKGTVSGSHILLAVGRKPNVNGLQLEQAGVAYSARGIEVDAYLRTTARNIYAVGDVIGQHQFTHTAASHASTAVRNIITPIKKTAVESDVVPWVTYTDPELARVGIIEREAGGTEHDVLRVRFRDVDRAVCDGTMEGLIKVMVTPKGKILGASILGPHAGELIMEYVLAMKHDLSVQDLAGTIHPYPTYSSASWTLAGSYYKRFISDRVRWLSQFLVRRF